MFVFPEEPTLQEGRNDVSLFITESPDLTQYLVHSDADYLLNERINVYIKLLSSFDTVLPYLFGFIPIRLLHIPCALAKHICI